MIEVLKSEDLDDRESHMKSLTRSELEQIASEVGVSYRDGLTTSQLQRQITRELDEQGYREQLEKWHELIEEVHQEEAEQRSVQTEDEEISELQMVYETQEVETLPYDYKLRMLDVLSKRGLSEMTCDMYRDEIRTLNVPELYEEILREGITDTEDNLPKEKHQRLTEYQKEHKGLKHLRGDAKESLEEVKHREYEEACKKSYEVYQGYKKSRVKEAV